MTSPVFEKNFKAVEARNPALAALLREGKPSIEIEATRSGDLTFRLDGRYFHSRYDPWKEARLQADEVLAKKPDWVVLFGLGCGYLLRSILDAGMKRVVVCEPSIEILKGVLGAVDLSSALSEKGVYLYARAEDVAARIREDVEGIENVVSFQPAPYIHAFPRELMDLLNRARNAHMTKQVGVKTDIDSRLDWIDNYYENMKFLPDCPPVDVLKGRFKGVPMVIAGAGPSLAKNAHLLKEIKGRGLIVAAVTAYRPLLKHGVVPDMVIASEKIDMKEYFTGTDVDRSVRLVLAEVAHPEMLGWKGMEKFVFFNPYMHLSLSHGRFWGSSYFANIGGSVTTAALDMGVMMGADPIIFVGQDLSFTGGSSHVQGGVYDAQELMVDEKSGQASIGWDYANGDRGTIGFRPLWLKGLDGRPVMSKFDWVTFHQWFEAYVEMMKKEGVQNRVINATEGGAYIEGMEHTTLAEAIDAHVNGGPVVDEVISSALSGRRSVDYASLVDSLGGMETALVEIEDLASAIVSEIEKAERSVRSTGVTAALSKNVKRMKRLEEKLFKRTEKAHFVWEALSAYTYELKEYLKEERSSDEAEQFERDLESTAVTYRKVRDICSRFLPVVRKASGELRERMEAREGKELVNG